MFFIFLFSLVIGCHGQEIVKPSSHLKHTEGIVEKHHENDHWKLHMVYNVRWNDSKNFLAVRREKTTEQFHKGAMHLGVNVPPGFEDAEMSFFYGMNLPNMMIEFKQVDDGVPECRIGIFGHSVNDELLTSSLLSPDAYKDKCTFQRKKIYKADHPKKVENPRLYGFCDMQSAAESRWQIANGIYNRPSKTPHCIYDFHKAATLNNEYEFFRYCAKGYFYQGLNYFDYPQSNIAKLWKDRFLYLSEGQLQCKISGNVEDDARLLAKGYTIEIVQYNYPQRLYPEMRLCPELSATLTSYHDKRKDGKFFFAAMVGAAQLDGQFKWGYKEPMGFWDESTYRTEYERMNLDGRTCLLPAISQATFTR